MNFKSTEQNKYLIKYGDVSEDFYIVLKGELSVWVPMTTSESYKILQKLKTRIKQFININKSPIKATPQQFD